MFVSCQLKMYVNIRKLQILKFLILLFSFFAESSSLSVPSSRTLVSSKMLQLRVLHNLGNISSILSDPARAFIVMRDSMKFRIKMQNKVTARNFLRRCLKKSVLTNKETHLHILSWTPEYRDLFQADQNNCNLLPFKVKFLF